HRLPGKLGQHLPVDRVELGVGLAGIAVGAGVELHLRAFRIAPVGVGAGRPCRRGGTEQQGQGEQGLHPTEPSSETSSSFLASTANSIGSSRNTCLQKPSTIIDTASSWLMPRARQ